MKMFVMDFFVVEMVVVVWMNVRMIWVDVFELVLMVKYIKI